jgi:hypothetical protein
MLSEEISESVLKKRFNYTNRFFLVSYGSTALVDLGRFFSSLTDTQSVGLLGRVISPSQGHYLRRVLISLWLFLFTPTFILIILLSRGSVVVKALRCNPESRGFKSR